MRNNLSKRKYHKVFWSIKMKVKEIFCSKLVLKLKHILNLNTAITHHNPTSPIIQSREMSSILNLLKNILRIQVILVTRLEIGLIHIKIQYSCCRGINGNNQSYTQDHNHKLTANKSKDFQLNLINNFGNQDIKKLMSLF